MKKEDVVDLFDKVRPSLFGPPNSCGVYGIYAFNRFYPHRDRLLYIGSAKNVKKRILKYNHVYIKASNRLSCMIYSKTLETENYIEFEKILIKSLKPILNKVGK